MSKIIEVICSQCNKEQEAVYGQFGAEYPCFYCDTAPIYLVAK